MGASYRGTESVLAAFIPQGSAEVGMVARIWTVFRKSGGFAWSQLKHRQDKWWVPLLGGVLLWLVPAWRMLISGLPTGFSDVAALLAALLVAFAALVVAFFFYGILHFSFESCGGFRAYLRKKLGAKMWLYPALVCALGLIIFMFLYLREQAKAVEHSTALAVTTAHFQEFNLHRNSYISAMNDRIANAKTTFPEQSHDKSRNDTTYGMQMDQEAQFLTKAAQADVGIPLELIGFKWGTITDEQLPGKALEMKDKLDKVGAAYTRKIQTIEHELKQDP
jgi:hypothetical protein